jgi:hypothetical protein
MRKLLPEFLARFREPKIEARQLVGVWRLKTVAGKHPSAFSIKSHQLEFAPEGMWSFVTVMTGHLEGVTVKGSGEWRIVGDELRYTVLDETRSASAQIEDGMLILTPDIAIAPAENVTVTAAYVLD